MMATDPTDPTDAELDAISQRVRAAQRRNLLVKFVSGFVVILGMAAGIGLNSFDPVRFRGGFWLGLIVGTIAGVAILKKFEVSIPDLE